MIGDGGEDRSGSVVVKPVPSGATVVGVPGRIVESLTLKNFLSSISSTGICRTPCLTL